MACIRKTTVFCIVFLALYVVFSKVEAVIECLSHSDCIINLWPYCCNKKFYAANVCKYSCVGESCSVDGHCAPSESCCSDYTCATACVGKSCNSDSDCATGECCDDTCKTGDCDVIKGLAGWIVAVIVISVIVVIVVPIAVVVACCFCAAAVSRRPVHAGVITLQPGTTATGTTVLSTQQQQHENLVQGKPMYFQNLQQYPPPPYQLQQHLPGSTGPPTEMTPQTSVKQY